MPVLEIDDWTDESVDERTLVGPIIRSGPLAEAVIDAIEEDNPSSDVFVLDRDDYVRIHTVQECRLTQESLRKHYGRDIRLAEIEIQMPSFKGRLETRTSHIRWYYES